MWPLLWVLQESFSSLWLLMNINLSFVQLDRSFPLVVCTFCALTKPSLTVGPRKVSHILSKSVVFHTDICNSPGIEFCTQSAVGCPFFFFPLWLFSCLNSICWKGYPFPLLWLVIRVVNRGPINVSLHFWPLFICVIQVMLCKNIQTTTWCEFNWNYRESIDQ